MELTRKEMAALIDHTLLKPTATAADIEALCREAREYGFFSVCVNPCYVQTAVDCLKDSDVKVCTVIGFPLGANTTEQKKREAAEAVSQGAAEVDMVINLGAVKSGDWDYVKQDIRAVVEATGGKALVKVILETGLLEPEEITKASLAAREAGAHFVKTSTGFLGSGATVEAVSLMKKAVGEELGIKASGGVRNLVQLLEMVKAGATRIGSSSGVAIMLELDGSR